MTSPRLVWGFESAGQAGRRTGDANVTSRTTVRVPVFANVHSEAVQMIALIHSPGQESCHSSRSETHCCFHPRSSSRSQTPPRPAQPCSRSWTLDESDARYTSGFAVHTGCKGISCRTSSSSLRNCCTQSGFDRRILVLCRHWGEDPLGCLHLDRGPCNAAAANLWTDC